MILGSHTKAPFLGLRVAIKFFLSVRVRYAPSPTGPMHLGGLRTALFNQLFARNEKGVLVVRIEDTDKNRQVEGSIDNIFESLQWLGIKPDESIKHGGIHGPYIQSQRMALYKNIEKHLLKNNKAYPCFCEQNTNDNPKEPQPYDGKCRNLTFEQIKTRIKNKEKYAVRIKSDLFQHPTHFYDQVFGRLQFKQFDDFVIVRRNGWPTFHLANVIDDWHMKITHVMRGQQWLTNTNKHIYLYMVLGADIPKFVHLPLIKAMNGKKLAKRDPQYSIESLRQKQYETEAIRSFLFGLGLRFDQQEHKDGKQGLQPSSDNECRDTIKEDHLRLLSKGEMIQKFSLGSISRVPIKFDIKQLDYLNKEALKARWKRAQQDPSELNYFILQLHQYIPSSTAFSEQFKVGMLSAIAERLSFIKDLGLFKYFFEDPNYFDEASRKDFQKLFGSQARLSVNQTSDNSAKPKFMASHCDQGLLERNKKIIHNLGLIVTHVISPEDYSDTELAKHISQYLFQSPGLKNEHVFHLLRYMITGRKSGPNIVQTCVVLGQEEVSARISRFWQL